MQLARGMNILTVNGCIVILAICDGPTAVVSRACNSYEIGEALQPQSCIVLKSTLAVGIISQKSVVGGKMYGESLS